MTSDGQERGGATSRAPHWWDEFSLESGAGVRWALGPFILYLRRLEGEWIAGYETRSDDQPDGEEWTVEPLEAMPERPLTLGRYVSGQASRAVRLVPVVPDRSLVARPSVPLHVLPGESAKIFISFPVWVDLRVGRQKLSLCEMPLKRLSDTWFGSSTLDGEIAYAVKTQARIRLDEVPRRLYRAITPVVIRNRGSDVLLTDRMNLPVPYLSIFTGRDGLLWTEEVTMLRSHSEELAELDIGSGPAAEAAHGKRLSEPRLQATPNVLVRAFSSILHPLTGGGSSD